MYYPDEVIEEVRTANDIVSVVSSYLPLRQRGNTYFGLCPFHNEKSPSFSVVPGGQFFHCFGCGAAGNVINFVMRIENYDFLDALKNLAQRINYILPEGKNVHEAKKNSELREKLFEINRTTARFFYDNLKSEEGVLACEYLDNRRILPKTRIKYGLGYSPGDRNSLHTHLKEQGFDPELIDKSGLVVPDKKGGFLDKFYSRLMFPIFEASGKIVGFGGRVIGKGEPKYLNSPDTLLFNKSKNLYSINYARLEKGREFLLAEGYMDVISLYQAGFKNAIAALGTACNTEHAKLIKRYADSVVLLFDSDEAGVKAAERAIPILKAVGLTVRVLQIKDAKDPDEYITKHGSDAFAELLKTAQNHVVFQVGNLEKKHKIDTTEGKISFTRDVSKLLAGLDSSIEVDVYTSEVSKLTNISEQSIKNEIGKIVQSSSDTAGLRQNLTPSTLTAKDMSYLHRNASQEKGNDEAKKNIIRIIAENRHVYDILKTKISSDELGEGIYARLLDLVYKFHEKHREIHVAELLNYFPAPEDSDTVAAVFVSQGKSEDYVSPNLEKEINESIKIIKKHNIEQRFIMSKDTFEMEKLMELKRNLEELYITISDG